LSGFPYLKYFKRLRQLQLGYLNNVYDLVQPIEIIAAGINRLVEIIDAVDPTTRIVE